jgi:hypothetical protein
MANTPLYKSLKKNGTTFYAFPGAAEDISAAYQNVNYKMYFSKYVLLNLPKKEIVSNPKKFDFENSFKTSNTFTPTENYGDQIVESLRNYVANQEMVIRESRLNNTKFYYDTNALETTSEKIFWKWCKKLNIIDFEPATPGDEYFNNLPQFESRDINDDDYFPEYLWREREVIDFETISFYETGLNNSELLGKLEIAFNGQTNFKVGDTINIYNVSNQVIVDNLDGDDLTGIETEEGINLQVLHVIPVGATQGQRVVFDVDSVLSEQLENSGYARLVYHKLVKYIGEINGVSNVQEANRNYTEVYAHIPDHTGMTPDILFRTTVDSNYKPNLTFPIIPSQYQPEILGAQFFNSPIVNTPQNYPGSYFGQFDTLDFTYKTSTGDELRRSGDYYGVKGDINNPIVDGSTIDGVILDFNTAHYVKMNIPNRVVTNFDQFNALQVDNQPPKDFEFNSILWYYTVEDNNGNTTTNLYGISFVDNPDNNPIDEEISLRFPTIKKLVANGEQDGTSYAFNLNLNFNIINDNPVDPFNPEAINSLFSMNLFNNAMSKLSSTNDSFLNIISEQSFLREEITNIKGLVYTQTDLNVINTRIRNLEQLLRLYSTNQIVSSDTVEVINLAGSPPSIQLNNIDTEYGSVINYNTSEMFTAQGIVPINIPVPQNRKMLVNITNNDSIDFQLPNNDKLTVLFDRDLSLRQSLEIIINGSQESSQNKKIDIFMISDAGSLDGQQSEVLLLGDVDLPVFYNDNSELPNSAFLWKDFVFNIDFNEPIVIQSSDRLSLRLSENINIISNSIKVGDSLCLNNLFIGTQSVTDYSGQYKVNSVSGSEIVFDMSPNSTFMSDYNGVNSPLQIHTQLDTQLSNLPYISLNKGKNIKLTRVSNSTVLSERYSIQITDIN